MLQTRLNNEKEVIADLKRVFEQASKDCADKIAALSARTDMENLQSIIYQKQYQQALKKQIDAILDILQTEEFTTISAFLSKSYEDGFISALYSLQEQGIPFAFPIDQSAVVKAIQTDSKISTTLYTRLGEDIKTLKTSIRSEISRGISTGLSYNEIARRLANGMNTPFQKAYNNAIRITRTEGNRVANQSAMDACYRAKEMGADVAKRWCAYLDSRTRESHAMIDGEIRELDEKFSNGLMFPLDPNGKASEVINCRCALEQKAKAFLDYEETQWLGNVSKMTDEQKERLSKKLKVPVDELEKYSDSTIPIRAKNYDDFKRQYKNIWNYEGSDLQKEVDARLARQKAEKEAAKALTKTGKSDRIKVPDTEIGRSVGAKSLNYDVIDPSTGEFFKFVEGSRIRNSEVFAGNGVKKALKEEVAEGLTKEFGGSPDKWQHVKGIGTLDYYGEELEAEVHWFQEETVGKVKFKVKEWLE